MTTHYEKIPFVWEEPKPVVQVPERLIFRSLNDIGIEYFTTTVSYAITSSLDRSDQKAVRELRADQAAAKLIAQVSDDFDYEPEWWQLGFNNADELVGFIQPVIYRGCRKDNLEEGTIYYIGVMPKQRGKRYIYDLLCQATQLLQQIGVWRIFCDTDVLNTPMIRAFQEVGYRQYSSPWQRPL
ncbi:GNAT family N-acetyltransferase [Nostoc sp. T09]|uniref:GNAT family N-acetyltransferase n=1 Tax=Nostoc sp. T09 TaxID=1932621 RepID=UPI000A36B814|nr:GNAT family N-acetyltransferase [Nostoc sp. T09]OUL33486.1 GNAT family N-acetyltransferase [Nostoc sp. T09]